MTDTDAILACHEFRCAWDWEAAWYVANDKTGKRIWERKCSCLRGCGSTRTDRRPPVLTSKITSRSYHRSAQWQAVGQVYFHEAGVERLKRQKKARGIK